MPCPPGLKIARALRHELCEESPHLDCEAIAQPKAVELLRRLPDVRKTLELDVDAAFRGDPAARSHHEIIFCYPGLEAITVYRLAHELTNLGVPLIPRMMTEYAHSKTGIDIHPGARIGPGFFIDHGTGVVIGETCDIGRDVKLYQGVTLGALSFSKDDDGSLVRGSYKRHPTLRDGVVVYANATILGGATVLGERAVVGSNVWLTESVPPDTTVVLEKPKLRLNSSSAKRGSRAACSRTTAAERSRLPSLTSSADHCVSGCASNTAASRRQSSGSTSSSL